MKIGIDIRSLMEEQYSGVSEYIINLLNHLFTIDSTNEYILFYNSHKKVVVPKFNFPNVKIIKFNYPNKFLNLSLRYLKLPKIDKMLGGIDIFFMPNLKFFSLNSNVKLIVTMHDLSFASYPFFFNFKSRLFLKLLNPKKVCQKSKTIISVSENTKKDLINIYKINEEKIKVIYSGLSDNYQPIQDVSKINTVKQKYNLPEKFILYLGNVEKRKNIHSIISAFNKLDNQDYKLIIAGKGKMYNQEEKIRFIGYVDANDKPVLYTLAKLFIYPSFYEGFGFPPLEAMACGTPVICSHASSLPEVIGQAAITIDPYNINEIKRAIELLISDEDLYQEMKSIGFNQAKIYNWQNSAKQLLNAFQNI